MQSGGNLTATNWDAIMVMFHLETVIATKYVCAWMDWTTGEVD